MTPVRPMERMTFGDDLSPASEDAWAWVTAQSWPGWRVDVLRAGGSPDTESANERHAPRRCGFTTVRTLSTPLEPRSALTGHEGTDLLVIGGRTGGALTPTTLGGTAEWLLSHAEVPVIMARPGGPVRTVLACIDPPRHALAAVNALIRLPCAERAVVTVLAVRGADGSYHAEADEAVRALTDASVRAHLRVVEPHSTIAVSSPQYRIFDAIDQMKPDLIVVGGARPSRVVRTIEGSTSLDIARYALCSVLVARSA